MATKKCSSTQVFNKKRKKCYDKETVKRANDAARRLKSNRKSLLSSRKMDRNFEMGDSKEVIEILTTKIDYKDLGNNAKRFVDKDWWK